MMSEAIKNRWSIPTTRRFIGMVAILAALLILGFYTVTDTNRLADNHLLEGADYVGYSVCHRITDRSFVIAGRQLPLCARCTGMYLGVILAFTVLGLSGRRRWAAMPPLRVILILIGFVAFMGIDGLNSYSHFFPNTPHLYEPQNSLRLVTGMGAGLTMGIILFPALAQTLWREQDPRPAVRSLSELTGIVFLAGVIVALVLSNQPTLLFVLGLASAAGVLLVLTAINTTGLLILTRRDALAEGWHQALLPLSVGLLLALIQIGVISFVRFSLTGTMTGLPGL